MEINNGVVNDKPYGLTCIESLAEIFILELLYICDL